MLQCDHLDVLGTLKRDTARLTPYSARPTVKLHIRDLRDNLMLAMTYRGPYRVRVMNKPDPQIEHPGDAIVRVTRACICGSDLHLYHGLVPDTRVGQTFGHEFVGVIEEVGAEVESLKQGDRVLIPFNILLRRVLLLPERGCTATATTRIPMRRPRAASMATRTPRAGYDGGQAEYVRVPFPTPAAIPIPDEVDDDNAALCTDAFPTGYQGAEMAGIKRGDTVVVFGAGPDWTFPARSPLGSWARVV